MICRMGFYLQFTTLWIYTVNRYPNTISIPSEQVPPLRYGCSQCLQTVQQLNQAQSLRNCINPYLYLQAIWFRSEIFSLPSVFSPLLTFIVLFLISSGALTCLRITSLPQNIGFIWPIISASFKKKFYEKVRAKK